MPLLAIDQPERLEALLSKAEPHIRKAFLNAVTTIKDTHTLKQMEELLAAGRGDEAVELAAAAGAIRVADGYAAVFVMAGNDGAQFLEDTLDVVMGFDVVNDRAVNIMKQERLRLIQGFTAEQRAATRIALVDGIERGLNPVATARNFRDSIGLTAKQQQAVNNYRRLLETRSSGALQRHLRDKRFDRTVERAIDSGENLGKAQIDRMVSRYREKYVKYRAEVIGRTEALRAVHQGNYEAYQQAIESGDLDPHQLMRTWVDAHDSRVRHTHRLLNGVKRGMEETFPAQGGPLRFPGDPRGPASETIQCRCVLSTRIESLEE